MKAKLPETLSLDLSSKQIKLIFEIAQVVGGIETIYRGGGMSKEEYETVKREIMHETKIIGVALFSMVVIRLAETVKVDEETTGAETERRGATLQ